MGPDEYLEAKDLNDWLDAYQDNTNKHVILIYDACLSGSFISTLDAGNTDSTRRTIITSTNASEKAYFQSIGYLSFSFQFWAYIDSGKTINEAFQYAMDDIIVSFNGYQHAQLKTNCDIIDHWIGSNLVTASDPPSIDKISGELKGSTYDLIAEGVIGVDREIQKVWASVMRPDFNPMLEEGPIIDLPEVVLTRLGTSNTYMGTYNKINRSGEYVFSVYAIDSYDTISRPKQLKVMVHMDHILDLNGDQLIDLKDAMVAIRLLAGIPFQNQNEEMLTIQAPIGMKDLLFILKCVMLQ